MNISNSKEDNIESIVNIPPADNLYKYDTAVDTKLE